MIYPRKMVEAFDKSITEGHAGATEINFFVGLFADDKILLVRRNDS